jgi:hypothetical protein
MTLLFLEGSAFGIDPAPLEPRFAGEFFDIKVPLENYYFVQSVLMVFGRGGFALPKDPAELEDAVWGELLLSYEAYRRGIVVEQEDLEKEVTDILVSRNVGFNWKDDRPAYEKWVQDNINESAELFENQIRHLLQIQKLREQVMKSIEPKVTEGEAHERFLDESSSLSVELLEFSALAAAEDFFRRAKSDAGSWEKEKEKRPKDFRRPGFVTLAFLIDIWKFPRDAAYKMLKMKKDQLYPPAPVYRGYAVFKVLESRQAEEARFAKEKSSYYAKVKSAKQYAGMEEWINNLKKSAKIKVYPEVQQEVLPAAATDKR